MLHNAMMIRLRILALTAIACSAAISAHAQKKTRPSKPVDQSQTVIATVGSESIILGDVERAFQKNLTRRDTKLSSVPKDTALDFLRLYTNYRLKVQDARDRGLDKDSAVKVDLANNRRLLSETFFYDKAVANRRVEELAQRRLTELEIGVILCAVSDPATRGWDTLASRQKAERIIAQIKSGAEFDKVARDSSDDKETAANGGRLPWISGGTIIKAVEDAAYSLPVGQVVSAPIYSRFGYFIVKLFRSAPRESVKFRHILLQPKDTRDSSATQLFADSLISILKSPAAAQNAALAARGLQPSGDVFSDLAKAYSDDKTSAAKGGYLGAPYTRSGGMESNNSRLVPDFERAIFDLKDGQISGKVNTLFGTHIIIRDSTKRPDQYVERDAAKRSYRRLYYEEDKRLVLDSVKKANGYGWNIVNLAKLLISIDTNRNTQDTLWHRSIMDDLLPQPLYNLSKSSYSVQQFVDTLRKRSDLRGFTLNRAGFERAINKMTDPIALDEATANLERDYQDFASLMREFNDGILLFKVEEKEVWGKLKFDTVDARAYYDTTKSRWMTETKYDISEIFVLNDSLLSVIQGRLAKGENFSALAQEYTQREGMRDKKGLTSAMSPKTSKVAQQITAATKVGDVIGPVKIDAGWSLIKLEGIVAPQQKTFESAISEIAPAYQDALQKRLTENWLSGVRQRHPVVYNSKVIDAIWPAAAPAKAGKKK
jgi:peptidyl-prolyl cis-trans isomerase SurA